MIISFILHRLSAGRGEAARKSRPRTGYFPHGLTTLEGGAGDPTGIPSQIIKIKSMGCGKPPGNPAGDPTLPMRSGLYRLVMIGVSGEQPIRGRLLKPRQKSEKSRQNRRAGKLGSGSAGTIRRPRVTARYGPPGQGEAAGRAPGRGRGWVSQSFAAGRPMTPQRRFRTFPSSPRNGEVRPFEDTAPTDEIKAPASP
jgi:hypothetical protein